MRTFVRLTDEEEDALFDTINSHFEIPCYRIIRNGYGMGVWKRLNSYSKTNRYVYLSLEFNKSSDVVIDERTKNKYLSICINTRLDEVAVAFYRKPTMKMIYFPKCLSHHWFPFWDAYTEEISNMHTNIINLYIFFKAIDLKDPKYDIVKYLIPSWSYRILKENKFFRKHFLCHYENL